MDFKGKLTLLALSSIFLVLLTAQTTSSAAGSIESDDNLQINAPMNECGSTPTDGCTVTQNTTFNPGTYPLPNGIIIGASNIVLDCNGATLRGNLTNQGVGIYIESKTGNTIKNCNIELYIMNEFSAAIQFIGSTNNNLENNHIQSNHNGIWLQNSNNNIVKKNTIQDGEVGINIENGQGNSFYQNNLVFNTIQASNSGTNNWNGGNYIIGGNYWSDHSCTDVQEPYDICDNTYISGLIIDNYPFEFLNGWTLNRPPILDPPIGNKNVNEGDTLQFSISAVDPNSADILSYSVTSGPGSVVGNTYTYNPSWDTNHSNEQYNVTLQVSDGNGGTDSETFQVTVNDINRPPELNPIGNKPVNENQTLQFTISATDPENDPLTYSASNPPQDANFNLTTRTFSWTPSYSQAGTYNNVQFVVSDGNLTDFENITITVNNINRQPVLDFIPDVTRDESEMVVIFANASDPDGDNLNYSISDPERFHLVATGSATFQWQTGYTDAGIYQVIVRVEDSGNPMLFDEQLVTVTVNNVNRFPMLAPIGNKNVNVDNTLQFTISATDPDINDTLIYSANNLPSGATFNQNTRTFTWTPTINDTGDHLVTFGVADDWAATDDETITIAVNENPPTDKCGDLNKDGAIDIVDVVMIVNIAFRGGAPPAPSWIADINGDWIISDILDVVGLINHAFRNGPEPTCSPSTASSGSAVIGFDSATQISDIYSIPVHFKNNINVAGLQLEVSYDPAKLELLQPSLTQTTNSMNMLYSNQQNTQLIGILKTDGSSFIPSGNKQVVLLNVRPLTAVPDFRSINTLSITTADTEAHEVLTAIKTNNRVKVPRNLV